MTWTPEDEVKHPRDRLGKFRDKAGDWARLISAGLPGGYRAGRDVRDQLDYASLNQKHRQMQYSADWRREQGDIVLSEIYEKQGFDAKPEVLTGAEMDQRISSGWTELYRGAGFAHHAEAYRSGDKHWAGFGAVANGTYSTADWTEASDHTMARDLEPGEIINTREPWNPRDWPGMLRLALRPDARVISWQDLRQEYRRSEAVEGDAKNYWIRLATDRESVLSDLGRFAAALGYDAVRLDSDSKANYGGADHYIILNRGATAVQEAYRG